MPENTTTNETAPPTPATKPGFKTTEFWLSIAAMLLTALYASGLLTSSTALAIAGVAATVLTGLGYKVSRTLVKTGAGALLIVGLLHTSACGASAREKTIRATLTTLDAAHVGFVAYDKQRQAEIVAHAPDEPTGEKQLAEYRAKREPVVKSFIAGYQAVATAALVNDDHSLAGLLAAALQVKEALSSLGVTP